MSESVIPVLNAIALIVLPNTVRASPFGAAIVCHPDCGGGGETSVHLKNAPCVLVSILTVSCCPAGPLPLGGVSVGFAHCVLTPVDEQADTIISATIAEINLVSVFMFSLCCVNKPFVHGYPARRGSGGALKVA